MIGVTANTDTPSTIKRRLGDHALSFVGVVVEDQHTIVFTAREDVRKTGVVYCAVDVCFMTCQGLNAGFGLVIPYFHSLCWRMGKKDTKSSLPVTM